MLGGFFYVDIIFLGLIAVLLIFTLYRVLGQRVGFQAVESTPIQAEGKSAVLKQMKLIDSHFSEKKFLDGAKKAYKVITEAFFAGNSATLKDLLTQKVYSVFQQSKPGKKKSFKVMSAEITEDGTEIGNDIAKISVNFVVSISKVALQENWIFEKHLLSNSSVWLLAHISKPVKLGKEG